MKGRTEGSGLPVFVYGTLRRGQRNYRMLGGLTVAEHPAILPGHALHDTGLPYVVPSRPEDRVVGKLMVVDPGRYGEVLASLDRLEGFRPGCWSLYVRIAATVRYRRGAEERAEKAWVYLAGGSFRASAATLVSSGDWLAAGRRRGSALVR
jgi:gamma-glutamylcyclotransferase (GGCT)/AIG2-like uncharacterized protein YtfP